MTEYDNAARRLQAALDAPPSSRLRVDLNDVRTLLAEHFELQARGVHACLWPACLTEAQQLKLAENVHRSMLGEDTGPDPDPGCDCTERLRAERDAATARAEQAEEARRASLAERDEWRRAFDAEHARAEQAEAALAEFEHEVQWAHQVNSLDGTWNGDAVVQADEQTAHRTARIVGLAVRRGEFRVDVVCRDVWTRATDWRPADATPRTAPERAADERGVQLPVDIDKLTAGADLQLTDEEFAEWTSAWQCTAPCCSEDATEQGDDAREVVIGAGSPETSVLTHCPTCGSPEWLDDGRRGWNPVDVECEVCAGTYDEQGDGEGGGGE